MKLFAALWRRKNMPPGHIWRGKHRLYKEVTSLHLQQLKDRLAIEEKNMFYLRHAFITPVSAQIHFKSVEVISKLDKINGVLIQSSVILLIIRVINVSKEFSDHISNI